MKNLQLTKLGFLLFLSCYVDVATALLLTLLPRRVILTSPMFMS